MKNIKLSADEFIKDVEKEILEESQIFDYIDENYGFLSSIIKKDEIQREINQSFQSINVGEIVEKNIHKHYGPVLEKIKSYVDDYNEEVDMCNLELEDLGIEKFKFSKIEYKEQEIQEEELAPQFEVERSSVFSPILKGYLTGAIVGGFLEQIALGTVLGAAGLVAVSALIPFFISKNVNKKKEELKQKIKEGIHSSLFDLRQEVDKLNDAVKDFINNMKGKFNEVKFASEEIRKMLERGELDEKIKELENQLSALQTVADVLGIKIIEEV